jgi:hypothetical protein
MARSSSKYKGGIATLLTMPLLGVSPIARALFAALTVYVTSCRAAVTWTKIGCDNPAVTFNGATVDEIWDNANLMAQNANSAIDSILNANAIKALSPSLSTIADNAKWMFGISVSFKAKLPSASKNFLTNTVKPVFTGIQAEMATDDGYLICNDALARQGDVGTCESLSSC